MTPLLYFIAGYLAASAVALLLAYNYWLRARRRVRQIQSSIADYQKASQTVGAALDHFQPKEQTSPPGNIQTMSRRAFITSENRRRQFLAEQRELQAHGMPNWFDNRPKRPTRKLSRQQRQSQTDRRIAVNESIRASARPGNSQWLILPTNNGQTVRPAPFQPGTATIPPVKEPSCSTLGTARP